MKTHLDIAHESNLGDDSQRVRMKFDEDSIAHLMSVLTDLYSDPEMAVIREYSTNAWDSHQAAGAKCPIEVELPNVMKPVFTVRDHGVGLSVTEVTEHFAKYGWSSKRDTDEEVGMLGLGCKSALTYTSQFTLIVTKAGERATVLVTRDADGCGAVQVVDTEATDAGNGVEVLIPVTGTVASFNARAQEFYRYWPKGSVLVNGEPVADAYGDHESDFVLDEDVIVTPRAGSGSTHRGSRTLDVLVMGNVPYPIDPSQFEENTLPPRRRLRTEQRIVARVPIGSIDFTPSREALHYTKRTMETLAVLYEYIEATAWRQAQIEIDSAPTDTAALRVGLVMKKRFQLVDHIFQLTRLGIVPLPERFKYHGCTIPTHFELDPPPPGKDSYDHLRRVFQWRFNSIWSEATILELRSARLDSQTGVSAEVLLGSDVVHLVGHKGNGLQAGTKQRIVEWCKRRGMKQATIIAYPTRRGLPWLEHVPVVTMSELSALKMPKMLTKDGASVAVPPPQYPYRVFDPDCYYESKCWRRVQKCPPGTRVWVRASEYAGEYWRRTLSDLVRNNELVLIRVTRTQESKFQADPAFASVPHVHAWVKKALKQKQNRLGRYGTNLALSWLKQVPKDCDDAWLAGLAKEYDRAALTRDDTYWSIEKAARRFGEQVVPKQIDPDLEQDLQEALQEYPLLAHLELAPEESIREYVNLVWASKAEYRAARLALFVGAIPTRKELTP